MKQPRVPEYREADGTVRYLRTLNLFLKDFSLETWKNVQSLLKAADASPDEEESENEDGMYAFHIDESGHLICAYDTSNPPPLSIDESGHLIYTVSTGKKVDLGRVVGEDASAASIETDETLTMKNGVLSVNTAQSVDQDNTLPVASGAVYEVVGNINALLETI